MAKNYRPLLPPPSAGRRRQFSRAASLTATPMLWTESQARTDLEVDSILPGAGSLYKPAKGRPCQANV